jgi:hypothetical protein
MLEAGRKYRGERWRFIGPTAVSERLVLGVVVVPRRSL